MTLNRGKYSLRSDKKNILNGTIKRHPDGFGFFISETPDQPDVYVPKNAMTGVMTNDRVTVEVYPEPGGKRFRGEVKEILKRAFTKVTGVYTSRSQSTGIVYDKSLSWGEDLFVDNNTKLKVQTGDWISAEIDRYPGDPKGFAGHLTSVIGSGQDPLTDSLRILHSSHIPFEFSQKTLNEAQKIPADVSAKDMKGRKDLQDLHLITIDGQTAKDFDDAVCVQKESGGYRLWVAIADVSHYVKPATAIDEDAYLRGTSTYFPNFVAPMLPEKLSNHLCSLMPQVPRLSFVAEMKINTNGELQDSKFYEAVINSHARVTYGEAQEIIDGSRIKKLDHVSKDILMASELAKILMARRFRDGSLDLEIPETIIEVDEGGTPVDILKAARLFSHRLIEELMLMANIAVAKEFSKHKVPALYRIHDRPKEDDIKSLQKFMGSFGLKANFSGGLLQKKLTSALQEMQGHPKAQVLQIMTLRSMAQAKYSPNNVGHFGLGFSDYAHFTSPIRRYPDLIVHRQLKAVLRIPGYPLEPLEQLVTDGTMLSACEQRSVKAERLIQSIKKARFMKGFLGQEFEGIISSVTKFGVFVLLRQYDVDGLVHVDDLFQEPFEFDQPNLRLVAKRSGLSYCIGDEIKVQVAAVDIDNGQIDFSYGEQKNRTKPRARKVQAQKPSKGRRTTEDNRGGVRKARVSKSRRKGKARPISR